MISRRQFLRAGTAVGAAALMPFALSPRKAYAAIPALLDGAAQPKYVNALPNLLDPAFIFNPTGQPIAYGFLGVRAQEEGKAEPDLFAAYVGTGQVSADPTTNNTATYRALLAEERRRGDQTAVRELTEIGPPPWADGCGGVLTCGTCVPPATCGGGGVRCANSVPIIEAVCDAAPTPPFGAARACSEKTKRRWFVRR